MCLPRRTVLAGAAGLVVAGASVRALPASGAQPAIVPRSSWGPGLAPTGPLPAEPDVRFLLVHHTVNANDYSPSDVVGLLEGIYGFHTGADKGWPDIAYNFLIDRFGTIYEGRTGSLAGAVAVDATGGSQGFAQLCCFIGDHSVAPPSDAAMTSMVAMLSWLASRYGVDLSPGATVSFESRGSNRWPAGSTVTTPTVAGHRDMSSTACPGDAAYAFVADGTFARQASALAAPPTTTSTTLAPTTTTSSSTTLPPTTTTTVAPTTTEVAAPVVADPEPGGPGWRTPAAVALGAAAAATGAVVALRRRTTPQ